MTVVPGKNMSPALGALLQGILDYAGLFPPAALPMPAAVSHYRRHLEEDTIGMLATFVCPASQLEALAEAAPGADWKLSVLATAGATTEETLTNLDQDIAAIEALSQSGSGFLPAALELRVPGSLSGDISGLDTFVQRVEEAISRSPKAPRKVFYEMSAWSGTFPVLAPEASRLERGVKIRTGGMSRDAFPSPEQIAEFLVAAVHHGIAFKATAGLHHPVRRFDASVDTHMHGFLNLFCAAAFAYAGYNRSTLVSILSEEDASEFKFSGPNFEWEDNVLDADWLARTRSEFALSFGSCSFIEPVQDLRALGYL